MGLASKYGCNDSKSLRKNNNDSVLKAKLSLNWTSLHKVLTVEPCFSDKVPDKKKLAPELLYVDCSSNMPRFDSERRVSVA